MEICKDSPRIAVFASGNGSNAENIIRYFREHGCPAEVSLIVCNNPEARVIERSYSLNVPLLLLTREEFADGEALEKRILSFRITHIVLAGFLQMIPSELISHFRGKIVNIHPSLLPKFGGKGMYGRHVHEAVVAARENVTGITIHQVSERYDEGEIIFQASTEIDPSDTPETVENKVHALEREYFPRVIYETFLK